MKMECDECGNIQEPTLRQIKTLSGLTHFYLQCERCYVKTTSYVTDKKLDRMIEDNARLREKEDTSDEAMEQWEEANDAIKLRMDRLTEKNKF